MHTLVQILHSYAQVFGLDEHYLVGALLHALLFVVCDIGYLSLVPLAGTIDADYRGEIMVLLINFSQQDFVINDGERIAQMVLAKHEQCDFIEVEELDETERGAGGYGHTGVK